ncbi:hypothetical protein KEM54_004678, partial [Ascosphaera aggregata]
MDLQEDGGFEWHAPFDPDVPLPWLDAEHDVGPAVLQIFKDGPAKWNGQRYVRVEKIEVKVPIPSGYQEQLEVLEDLFYHKNAPFFPLPEFLNPPPSSPNPTPRADPSAADDDVVGNGDDDDPTTDGAGNDDMT